MCNEHMLEYKWGRNKKKCFAFKPILTQKWIQNATALIKKHKTVPQNIIKLLWQVGWFDLCVHQRIMCYVKLQTSPSGALL